MRRHVATTDLSHDLTETAHAASEDVRTYASVTADWQEVQAQVRVVPVVQRLLRALHALKKAG